MTDYKGTIYIVFVHTGTIIGTRDPISKPPTFTVTPMSKSQVRSVGQEPQSSTELHVNEGLMHFDQTFPMFKTNGLSFNFIAKYNATLIGNFERSGRIAGQRTEFSVQTFQVSTNPHKYPFLKVFLETL